MKRINCLALALTAMAPLVAIGCGGPGPSGPFVGPSSADSIAAPAGAQMERLELIAPRTDEQFLSPTTTPDEAQAALPAFVQLTMKKALADCAATLGMASKDAFVRLAGLQAAVVPGFSDGNVPVLQVSSRATICSNHSLDDRQVVLFGKPEVAHGAIGTDSRETLHAGDRVLVIVDYLYSGDNDFVGSFLVDYAAPGTTPVNPHLLLRMRPGNFTEVGALPHFSPRAGLQVDLTTGLALGSAEQKTQALVPLTISPDADRLEMYLRVNTWSSKHILVEDPNGVDYGALIAPAADEYISDFGRNFSLPVTSP